MEKISFVTEDRVTIVGNWQDAHKPRGMALLLHMMPATKESFADLQRELEHVGISSLAIDLRGHGESVVCDQNAKLDYRDLDDSGHQASRQDVEAAVNWLKNKTGFGEDRLLLVGASIGANLAILFAAAHQAVPAVAALSPGLDYHGFKTLNPATAMNVSQKLLLAASADDPYSLDAAEKLKAKAAAQTEVVRFEKAGHGTNIFSAEKDFINRLVEWLIAALSGAD